MTTAERIDELREQVQKTVAEDMDAAFEYAVLLAGAAEQEAVIKAFLAGIRYARKEAPKP